MEDKNPWITHSKVIAYDNPWIQVTHEKVTTPGNSPGIYGRVHFKNLAIGILPIDEEFNTWLVGQYRYVLAAYSWEIPQGGCPLGTDPVDTAKRELKEETGLVSSHFKELMQVHTSNSVCDEKAIIYIAKDLELGVAEPEDTEELTVRKLPIKEAIEMVEQGLITDSLSIAGILKIARVLKL